MDFFYLFFACLEQHFANNLRHVASFLKGADLSKTLTCITIPISKILIRRGRGNTYNLYALQLMILFIP